MEKARGRPRGQGAERGWRLYVKPAELARLRLKRGWTHEELGHKAGLSPVTIGVLERDGTHGRRKSMHPQSARRLAAALGCRIEEIADIGQALTPATAI